MKTTLFLIFTIILFTGCADKYAEIDISQANLKKVAWKDIEGFDEDNLEVSFETFKLACTKDHRFDYLKSACEDINKFDDAEEFFTKNFIPYKLFSEDDKDKGLITGYYEPILNGSRKKTDIYKYPIYKVPEDLVVVDLSSIYPELKKYRLRGKIIGNKLVPYESRGEINDKENLEPLVYLDSKIDKFFLEIQGSGKIRLDNGEIINVGYANQNGHKYYSIGRKLIQIGAIKKEDVSLESIKSWLISNPDRQDEILNLNKSVVFFSERKQSATGALGVPLVAKRNLAVDTRFIPLGLPVFINTTNPLTDEEINRLMIAADVGGAIKGEIRADMFFGNTLMAKKLAGEMKQKGELILFIPNKYAE